ncbi:DUF58 domain-containing protein [Paenibacillus chungangensis]|uniref:DUF58 domain-containing protein n=1 Tax=Paenibacillus chungangensis TaxID=696535 RepID=A0ABW3HXI4_9BACL
MRAHKEKQRRTLLIASLYLCSLFYFLFQGGKTALMLFVILNLLLIYLFLGRWSGITRVSGSRTFLNRGSHVHEGSITAGSSLEIGLQVKVPGIYPLPYIIVKDTLVRHDGGSSVFETSFIPGWKRIGSVRYTTPPLRRGEYRFRETECEASDIFGLLKHTGSFQSESVFSVLPQTVHLRNWSGFQRGIRGPYSHAAASRAAKETTQLDGIREYLHGDKLSRIHWNATARTGHWKSKAFERESLPRTILILDRCQASYGKEASNTFELAVSVAASLLEHGLKRDTAMGLLSIGDRLTSMPPRSGLEQRNAMMKHLTFVHADAQQALSLALPLAESSLLPGCFALVVSGETGGGMLQTMEWISRRGITPCLLHVGDDAEQDTAWKAMIRSRGWLLYDIRHLHELPEVLEGSGIA